ncbi:MAG TPA: ribosome small subunit-dependent GTPase A [Dongiaceae bacterium]|nr:ribosome small subunit-dependent GTPase A [Dongiaceae bacterium]
MDFNACVVLLDDGGVASATARGALMGRQKSLGNTVVVGDVVGLEWLGGGSETRPTIVMVEPRKSVFSRRASGREPAEQVVAGNVDEVAVVAALADPAFKPGLVDRIFAQCVHQELPARLVLNKIDVGDRDEAAAILAAYARAGFGGALVSARTGEGVGALRSTLRGRCTLFAGHSGVGKSSLLNALEPGFELLAGQVNEKTGKGRHTTTAVTLLRPEPDIELIDTPGVRAFGLWGIEPESLERAWPELAPYLGHCRFGDCTHVSEPGCAVRAAVADGHVATRRYESFLKLRDELAQERELERARARGRP